MSLEGAPISLSFLLFYILLLVITLFIIIRTGIRDLGQALRKMRKKGLSFREVFFRLRPYDFWPEREVSFKEAIKRGLVSSIFLFSFTGILGTCMRWAGLSQLDSIGLFCLASTVALIVFPLVTIIYYINLYMLKKYGQPLSGQQDSRNNH